MDWRVLSLLGEFQPSNDSPGVEVIFTCLATIVQEYSAISAVARLPLTATDVTDCISVDGIQRYADQDALPEVCATSTPHMVAPVDFPHQGMAIITPLPVIASCHLQQWPQGRICSASAVYVSEIVAASADGCSAMRTSLGLGVRLDVSGSNPPAACRVWTVPPFCRGYCMFFCSRCVKLSSLGVHGGGNFLHRDLLRTTSDWESPYVLQRNHSHLA